MNIDLAESIYVEGTAEIGRLTVRLKAVQVHTDVAGSLLATTDGVVFPDVGPRVREVVEAELAAIRQEIVETTIPEGHEQAHESAHAYYAALGLE